MLFTPSVALLHLVLSRLASRPSPSSLVTRVNCPPSSPVIDGEGKEGLRGDCANDEVMWLLSNLIGPLALIVIVGHEGVMQCHLHPFSREGDIVACAYARMRETRVIIGHRSVTQYRLHPCSCKGYEDRSIVDPTRCNKGHCASITRWV